VVLLGGQAGHWVEQVREVGRPLFDRPVLHGVGNCVGDLRVQRGAELDRLLQRLEDWLGQPLALDRLGEDVLAEQVLDVDLPEVDAVESVRRTGNGLDETLTTVRGTHGKDPNFSKKGRGETSSKARR